METRDKVIHFYAHQGVEQFRCLGGECEDSCCRGWDIFFDRKHFELIQRIVVNDASAKQKFSQNLEVVEGGDENRFAVVNMDAQGCCPFLDSKQFCSLHSKHGIEVLSNTCAFYPRMFSRTELGYEISGALSCPEMARKTLLAEGSFQFNKCDASHLPRQDDFSIANRVDESALNTYQEKFTQVRAAFLKITNHTQINFATRRYAIASLAAAISDFYYQGCMFFDSKPLEFELQHYTSTEYLLGVQDFVSENAPEEPIAMIVVQAILRLYLQKFSHSSLGKIVEAELNYFQQLIGEELTLYGGNLPPDELACAYNELEYKFNQRFGQQLDVVLLRYLQNILYREWFIKMPNPFAYMHMINIRISLIKFLIVSHPEIRRLVLQQNIHTSDEEMLNKIIIDVIYKFSRALDHNSEFFKVVYYAIVEQDLFSPKYTLPFVKF